MCRRALRIFEYFQLTNMPPRKRTRTSGGSLTGGTGDVKPQFLTQTTPIPSGNSDYAVVEIILPTQILSAPDDDMAVIFEVLRVDWYLGIRDETDSANTVFGFLNTRVTRATDDTCNVSTIGADLSDPGSFAAAYRHRGVVVEGGAVLTLPISVDTMDGNGNGILVASSRLFMIVGSINNTAPSEATVKILYRMTAVGIKEYVGIVASQAIG